MKKQVYLFFSAAMVILITGYFFYKENKYPVEPGSKKPYSIDEVQKKPGIEKSGNFLPAIKKAKLQLESVDNTDRLTIIIEDRDMDNKGIKYNYEWFQNGEPLNNNKNSIAGFKKGDEINVKITPLIGRQYGPPKLLSIKIGHVTPKIHENKEINFDGNVLGYQVKAVNPNGGALEYSLIDSPEGMTINNNTGMIKWHVKTQEYGKRQIKVRIVDDNGAEVVYPLNIDLGKDARKFRQ